MDFNDQEESPFVDAIVGTERRQFVPLSPVPRKGLYFRAQQSGRRLYFSDNEIHGIMPLSVGYRIVLHGGATYDVRSSIPDETIYEVPARESVKGDHFFRRS